MKHKITATDFGFDYTGSSRTEKEVIQHKYPQLTGEDLHSRICNKSIQGDYPMGYKFITEIYEDGTAEGMNDAGAHNFGTWEIDMIHHTLSTKWSNGWFPTTTRAYDVEGNIEFFDVDTGNWRTTFKTMQSLK